MHFDWHFTATQIIWTLTFAAQLVLIVVLLGRDRARSFPWFTASIVALTFRALCERELYQRMPELTFITVILILANVVSILGLLVVAELARKAFAGANRSLVLINLVGLLLVTAGIMSMWGAWPAWKTLTAESHVATLRILDLIAEKTALLVNLLNIELGLIVVIFGRRFNAPWRSHTQRIVIGLSTASLGGIAVQTIWQYIVKTAAPRSQEEARPILDFHDRLFNANRVLYIVILIWWIVTLWMDETEGGVGAQTPVLVEVEDPPLILAPIEEPMEPEGADPAADSSGGQESSHA